MLIVHVFVHVAADAIDDFRTATLVNARASVEEPGIVRFDLIQQLKDPAQFLLIEIYREPSDAALHKETAHYATWRDTVAPMMAKPRRSVEYAAVFPVDGEWERARS